MATLRRRFPILVAAIALGCGLTSTVTAHAAAAAAPAIAGYGAYPGVYTSGSAAWIQPLTVCTSPTSSVSFWVGLDGAISPTAEQIGTEVICTAGVPAYHAWYDMFPAPPVILPFPVGPGDRISASVVYTAVNTFTLTITDLTRGWTSTTVKSAAAARSSAEILVEGPGAAGSLADFGTVTFTNCLIDGAPLAAADPHATNMVSGSGVLQALTSPLLTPESFEVTWKHA